MDKLFKALSDKNRRQILEILKQKDMTVTDISEHFDISGASLSHHLNVLKSARLVTGERRGQHVIYSLNTSVFEETLKKIMNIFKQK